MPELPIDVKHLSPTELVQIFICAYCKDQYEREDPSLESLTEIVDIFKSSVDILEHKRYLKIVSDQQKLMEQDSPSKTEIEQNISHNLESSSFSMPQFLGLGTDLFNNMSTVFNQPVNQPLNVVEEENDQQQICPVSDNNDYEEVTKTSSSFEKENFLEESSVVVNVVDNDNNDTETVNSSPYARSYWHDHLSHLNTQQLVSTLLGLSPKERRKALESLTVLQASRIVTVVNENLANQWRADLSDLLKTARVVPKRKSVPFSRTPAPFRNHQYQTTSENIEDSGQSGENALSKLVSWDLDKPGKEPEENGIRDKLEGNVIIHNLSPPPAGRHTSPERNPMYSASVGRQQARKADNPSDGRVNGLVGGVFFTHRVPPHGGISHREPRGSSV